MCRNKEKISGWINGGFAITLLILIASYFVNIMYTNLNALVVFGDTDMYLDTLVAKLMWEQKTLFPDNWIFGNQYYVIATPVLAALLYGILGNLNIAMGLASTLMTIGIMMSFAWMIWPFVKRKTNILVGIVAMFACLICTEPYNNLFSQLFYIMCSYYACYLITAFLVWGEYARLKANILQKRNTYVWTLLVCVFLSFCMGMQSIRQTIVMIMPLCALEFLYVITDLFQKRPLPKHTILFVGINTVANVLGIICIKVLNIPQHVIYGELSLVSTWEGVKKNIKAIILAVKDILNMNVEPRMWITILTVVMCLLVMAAIVLIVYNKVQEKGLPDLIILSVFSIGIVLAGKLVSTMALRSVYLFIWYPLVCISIVYLLERVNRNWKYWLCLSVFLLMAYKSYAITYGAVKTDVEGRSHRYRENLEVVEWMEENNYDTVYGVWNLASDIALVSNGKVVATCWPYETPEDIFGVAPWIINTDTLDPRINQQAVYIVRNENESYLLEKAAQMGVSVRKEKVCDVYTIYTSEKLLIYPDENILG